MKTVNAGAVLVMLLGFVGVAGAGNIDGTPIAVECDTTIKVTDDTGSILTLDPSDPILAAPCPKDGITIRNSGKGAAERNFVLDCQMGLGQVNHGRAIGGSKKGIGVELAGPGLSVLNCSIKDFKSGISAKGDSATVEDNVVTGSAGDGISVRGDVLSIQRNKVEGSAGDGITAKGNELTIQDNRVASSAGDGFVVSDSRGIKDEDASTNGLVNNRALDNGGWGFNVKGNRVTANAEGELPFNQNIADHNGLGGFLVKGEGNALSGLGAFHNLGPGIHVISTSCCAASVGDGQSLKGALALFNVGPGIIYSAKDDRSNCLDDAKTDCLPLGFDHDESPNEGFGNGSCPEKSRNFSDGVCLIVQGKQCKQSTVDKCSE